MQTAAVQRTTPLRELSSTLEVHRAECRSGHEAGYAGSGRYQLPVLLKSQGNPTECAK